MASGRWGSRIGYNQTCWEDCSNLMACDFTRRGLYLGLGFLGVVGFILFPGLMLIQPYSVLCTTLCALCCSCRIGLNNLCCKILPMVWNAAVKQIKKIPCIQRRLPIEQQALVVGSVSVNSQASNRQPLVEMSCN